MHHFHTLRGNEVFDVHNVENGKWTFANKWQIRLQKHIGQRIRLRIILEFNESAIAYSRFSIWTNQ